MSKQTQLRLTCVITGKSRPTTQAYLDNKSTRLGSNAADIAKNYICREAMVLLNSGKSYNDVRAELNIQSEALSAETVAAAIAFNGKRSKSSQTT